jgi:hypothetical protein
LIGVAAVLVILGAAILPVVIRRMDQAARTKEAIDTTAISNAIILQVLRSNTIPNDSSWVSAAANWSSRPMSQIQTNDRSRSRLFFYDWGGWMSNASIGGGFVQGPSGTTTSPSSYGGARMVIVSSIARSYAASSGGLPTSDFNTIWNAQPYTLPAYLTGQGRGEDCVIQRISLDSMFHHLILANRDPSTIAAYSIKSTALSDAVTVANNASGLNSYFLDGTSVGLWAGTNGVATNMVGRFILSRDTSLAFEAGTWANQLSGSGTDNSGTAQAFALTAATFVSTAAIPGQHQGADVQGTLSSFYSFMFAYSLWANKCPHFPYTGNNGQASADWQILNTLGQNGSAGIINGATGSGGGGLLQ